MHLLLQKTLTYGSGEKKRVNGRGFCAHASRALIRKELPKVGTRKLQDSLKECFMQHGIKMGRDALISLLSEEDVLVKKGK